MSTSLLHHKRRFHTVAEESAAPKCSPGKIQFLTLDEARRKRSRQHQSIATSKQLAFDSKFDVKSNQSPLKGDEKKHSKSSGASKQKRLRSSSAMDTEDLQVHSSKRIRRPSGFVDENVKKPPNPFVAKDVNVKFKADPNKKKKYYTEEQVKRIVNNSLKQQEEQLREEYNKILNERLAEQFENFTRFNQDYVYRQLNSRACSYVS